MPTLKTHLALFFAALIVIALLALAGPEERALGANVRIVYLHGAWVLTAELAFLAAGLIGLLGLIRRRAIFHHWSLLIFLTRVFLQTTSRS